MRINWLCETLEILVFVAVLLLGNISEGDPSRMKFCSSGFGNSCIVRCRDLNMSFWKDVDRLKNMMRIAGEGHTSCTLVLNHCFFSNKTFRWEEKISTENLESLKLINSQVNLNDVALNKFKNLKRLTIQNTTTNNLSAKTFSSTPKLRKLCIRNNVNLKWVEEGLLQATHFKFLQIQGMNLNQSETKAFFKNLTGGHDVPTIQGLDWSHNNFGNFTKDLLLNFVNLKYLALRNSNVAEIEEEMFVGKNIKVLYLDRNKVERTSEKTFGVVRNITKVCVNESRLMCDFHMKWLQDLVKKREEFQNVSCTSAVSESFLDMCSTKTNKTNPRKTLNNTSLFTITNPNLEYLEVNITKDINLEETFFWYFNFSNPTYNLLQLSKKHFQLHITPNTSYLICMLFLQSLDCQSYIPEATYEDQTWLTKRWISITIILTIVIFLLGVLAGASFVYLLVHKNPSLIRGSKRVIEVKRHDKAQVLIMPRGYESSNDADNAALSLLEPRLEPSLSSDTLSTASYVSANQPTQFEIFAYRLNRLREIFQNNNNLPPPVPSHPARSSTSSRQRIPPNVDLLFEYEWYTITTTTTQA